MATAYTSLLGLALPVTGELSGTWGNTVNTEITSLLDSAIAGTTTISADADITLTTTTGAANEAREAIILWTAGGTATRNITAPAQSKAYIVINASSSTQSIVLRGAGPTTGVTIIKGEAAVCAWNGTDFIKVSNISGAGVFSSLTVTGTTTLSGLTASTALALDASKNVVSVTNTGTGNNVLATSPTLVTPALGTPSSGVVTNLTGTASININGTVGATTASTGAFTTLSATGVATFSAGTAALPAITTTGDTNTGIFFPAADTIAFAEGGAEAMRIDSSGNVLVGTTSSTFSGQTINGLGVSKTGAALLALNNSNNTNQSWSHFIYDSGLGTAGTYSIGQIINGSTSGLAGGPFTPILNIAVPSSASNSPKVFIDSSGNVGIGTSSPGHKLDVAQSSAANNFIGRFINTDTGASSGAAVLVTQGAVTGQFQAYGNAAINFGTQTNHPIVIQTNTTERIRIDTSGNVGIGTSSPSTYGKFVVAGGDGNTQFNVGTNGVLRIAGYSSTYSGALLESVNTAQSGYLPIAINGSYAVVATGNTERMRIDSSGNVGIGTSSPASKLDIPDIAANGLRLSGSGDHALGFVGYTGNAATQIFSIRNDGISNLYINTQNSVPLNFGVSTGTSFGSLTSHMVINSSGNVGIGGGTPGSNPKLSMYGGIRFLSTEAAANTYTGIGSIVSDTVSISTSGSERMRIDASGNLFLNCTTTPTSNTTAIINAIAGGDGINLKQTSDGSNMLNLWQTGANTYTAISFNKGNTQTGVGSISVTTSATAYNTSSDYRLKNTITPMTGALSKVALLKPVTYKWNIDGSSSQGFIAHELQAVVPECVVGEKDGVETYIDEDGNEATRPAYQGIDTSFLVATLTAAIQEQQALITSLTARITALEST